MANKMTVMAGWLVVSADKVLKDYGFICADGKVVAIKPNKELENETDIRDFRKYIVTPGFVNTHHHMYEAIGRGLPTTTGAKSLKPILEEYWWPMVENRVTTGIIRVTTRYAVMLMLKAGYTCVGDILEAPNATFGERLSTEKKVMEQAGMKAVLSVESNERLSRELGESALMENYEFTKQQMEAGSHIRGMMCTHTTFSSSPEFLRKARRLSRELDGRMVIHLDEGPDEGNYCYEKYGKRPVELYEEMDFLDDKLLAGQCVTMDPREIEFMIRRKVNVSHQPISNCINGDGFAPIIDFVKGGNHIGFGTDGSVCNPFETMRAAACIQRSARLDLTYMPNDLLLKIATEDGAIALGYTDVGKLDVGYCADFLVIPQGDYYWVDDTILDEIVMFKNPGDIYEVYTDGVLRCRNGVVVGLDEAEVMGELSEEVKKFRRNA